MKNKKKIVMCSLIACVAFMGTACDNKKKDKSEKESDKNTSGEVRLDIEENSDISDALQKVIDDSNGDTSIIIPEGTYKLTKGIKVNKKGLSIKGEGKVVLDGQARLEKNADYEKPASDLKLTPENYVPAYTLVNAETFLFDGRFCDVFKVSESDITFDNIEITGVYKDLMNCVIVGIRIDPGSDNITVKDCKIHDMGVVYKEFSDKYNAHGIIVDGNDSAEQATINNTTIKNCEIYNMTLGQSEALVLNGNVESFEVSDNYVHDCDNIGIDVIGYEHDGSERDRARGTKDKFSLVARNTVINISSGSNTAYRADPDEDGTECCCAGGIYVDGGTCVNIQDNYVRNSDIGVELASEHENVTTDNIHLINNTLIENNQLAGVSIGGYDDCNGGTTDCVISGNTIYNTGEYCLNLQKKCYSNNVIENNIFIALGEAEGYFKDEDTKFENTLANNLSNFNLNKLKKDNSNMKTDIEFVDCVDDIGKQDCVIKTDADLVGTDGKNVYGSSVTRNDSEK